MPKFNEWYLDYRGEKGDRTGPNILFNALPELSFYDKKLDAKIGVVFARTLMKMFYYQNFASKCNPFNHLPALGRLCFKSGNSPLKRNLNGSQTAFRKKCSVESQKLLKKLCTFFQQYVIGMKANKTKANVFCRFWIILTLNCNQKYRQKLFIEYRICLQTILGMRNYTKNLMNRGCRPVNR